MCHASCSLIASYPRNSQGQRSSSAIPMPSFPPKANVHAMSVSISYHLRGNLLAPSCGRAMVPHASSFLALAYKSDHTHKIRCSRTASARPSFQARAKSLADFGVIPFFPLSVAISLAVVIGTKGSVFRFRAGYYCLGPYVPFLGRSASWSGHTSFIYSNITAECLWFLILTSASYLWYSLQLGGGITFGHDG